MHSTKLQDMYGYDKLRVLNAKFLMRFLNYFFSQENMIVLERPTTADYMKIIGGMDDEERRRAEERRRQREMEEAER